MIRLVIHPHRHVQRNAVAAAIASILALAAPLPALAATNWVVTNCADSAPGSLRATIAAGTTLSGDSVDLSALSCPSGKLSLTSSTISIAQDSLTILGPGKAALQIDASALAADGRAFAFLSEYEGLGLTPLEALAAGVPPVLLDTPVARESCGDAALYVPAHDVPGVTRALEAVLFDHSTRLQLLQAAPRVLARYAWPRAARETLAVLEAAAS